MSRNIGKTNCNRCPAPRVALLEVPRLITEKDAGIHYQEFHGLYVADAECPLCGARYLAWIDWPKGPSHWHRNHCRSDGDYTDLSYRSAFNDQPGADDMPRFEMEVETIYHLRPLP